MVSKGGVAIRTRKRQGRRGGGDEEDGKMRERRKVKVKPGTGREAGERKSGEGNKGGEGGKGERREEMEKKTLDSKGESERK